VIHNSGIKTQQHHIVKQLLPYDSNGLH